MDPFKIGTAPMRILAADLRSLHLKTQAVRFIRLFVMYFIAHLLAPRSWDWQAVAMLAATSAEAAFQQIAPQLPVAQLLNKMLSSTALRTYLAELVGIGTAGQPQTVAVSGTPLTAPPAASPAAGTPQRSSSIDPAADPAQKPQAVPKSSD